MARDADQTPLSTINYSLRVENRRLKAWVGGIVELINNAKDWDDTVTVQQVETALYSKTPRSTVSVDELLEAARALKPTDDAA